MRFLPVFVNRLIIVRFLGRVFCGIVLAMKTKTKKSTSKTTPINDKTITPTTIDRGTIEQANLPPAVEVLQGEERKSVAWYEKDGKILWERMRPSTREALKEFLQRDDVLKALEVKRPEVQKKLVGESLVERTYKLVGKVESFVAQKSLKAPKEIADTAMCFDEDELNVVVPPTVRLLNKYGAEWIESYGDWLELGIGLTSIQVSKFAMLRALLDREEKKAKNRPEVVEIRQEKPLDKELEKKPEPKEDGTSQVNVETLEEQEAKTE